jgi:thiamine pyrophosphate-dependent acetolactate synthase large subunit-like protein
MLTKEEVLRPLAALRSDAVVVTTMGVVRPWGRISQSELDFASADSAMGHAADLALGIAIAQPLRKVICLNGDGSMLMTLGTLATIVEAAVSNYFLFVIENNTYEITGNQAIPGAARLDFVALARGAGFKRTYYFDDPISYAEILPHVLSGQGPVFVLLRIGPGSEGPISRSEREEAAYLKVSIAESAHALRRSLLGG